MAVTFSALIDGQPYVDADGSQVHAATLNNNQANNVVSKLNQYNPTISTAVPGSATFAQVRDAINAYKASVEWVLLNEGDKSRWNKLMIIAQLAWRTEARGGTVDWR